MADMIVKYRIMPEDGEIEYASLESAAKEVIEAYDDKLIIKEVAEKDVGFGLKAVSVTLQFDEKLGSEPLENNLMELEVVGDVVVELMDRL